MYSNNQNKKNNNNSNNNRNTSNNNNNNLLVNLRDLNLNFDLPKVIRAKWTNTLYNDLKLNDEIITNSLPEFETSSYLKNFCSQTMYKWIDNTSEKSSINVTNKNVSLRASFDSKNSISESDAYQNGLNNSNNSLKEQKHQNTQNKLKFSYNLDKKITKLEPINVKKLTGAVKDSPLQRSYTLYNNKSLINGTNNNSNNNSRCLHRINHFGESNKNKSILTNKLSNSDKHVFNKLRLSNEHLKPKVNFSDELGIDLPRELFESSDDDEQFEKVDFTDTSNASFDIKEKDEKVTHDLINGTLTESQTSLNLFPTLNLPRPSTPKSHRSTNIRIEMSKPKLKCKTPIHFAVDRRIVDMKTPGPQRNLTPISRQLPSKTPKLLKRLHIESDAKSKELENLFVKLDLDEDGHLSFELIDNLFCKNLNPAQHSFIRQIYNILSNSTFFGLSEFKTLIYLIDAIRKQKYWNMNSNSSNLDQEDCLENYWEHFNSTDFEDYNKEISDYILILEVVDIGKKTNVLDIMKQRFKSMDNERLIRSLTTHFDSQQLYLQLNYTIKGGGDTILNKTINYLSLIPLFIYIESIVKNKIIFKRRQNTILNLKDATNLHSFNRRTNFN